MIQRVVANILDHFLQAPAGRTVAVAYPPEKAAVAEALAQGLAERGCPPVLLPVPEEAPSLPDCVVAAFGDPDLGLIVLLSPRLWAQQGLAARFVMRNGRPSLDVRCSPLFVDTIVAPESFLRVYASDPAGDRAYLARLRDALPAERLVHVTAPGGTDLVFRSRAWQACGNTEVLTAPVEGTAKGIIVADLSVHFGLASAPITLRLQQGRVAGITCRDPSDRLFALYRADMERHFAADEANRMLAEVGVGGNGGAIPSGVLMEDEAVRDTCHFCFGDNSRYGGANRSDWHGGTAVVRGPALRAVD